MKKIYKIGLLVLSLALLPCLAAHAQHDVFIKWGTGEIKGESQDKSHIGWSDVISIELGMESLQGTSIAGASRNSSRTLPTGVSLTKRIDFASVDLASHLATGKIMDEVIIEFVRNNPKSEKGSEVFLSITLKDVIVIKQELSTSDGDDIIEENLVLKYGKIEYTYRKQKPDGTLGAKKEFKWDFEKNQESK